MSEEKELKLACLHQAGGDLDHAQRLFDWVSGSVRATPDSEAAEVSAPKQDKPQQSFNYRHPSKYGTDVPRRCYLEELTPEERAIRDLVDTVERLGAHPLLTATVIQLMKAGEDLADWVDIGLRDKAIAALSPGNDLVLLDENPAAGDTEVRNQAEGEAAELMRAVEASAAATLGPRDAFLESIMERGGTWHDGGNNPAPNWFCDIYVPAAATNLGDEPLHLEGQPSNAYIWGNWGCAYVRTQPMQLDGPLTAALRLDDSSAVEARACTCHPDDNPPVPCPQKHATRDCWAAVGRPDPYGEQWPPREASDEGTPVLDAEPSAILRSEVPPASPTYVAPSGDEFATINGQTHLIVSDEQEAEGQAETHPAAAYAHINEIDEPAGDAAVFAHGILTEAKEPQPPSWLSMFMGKAKVDA